jgi:hypothetical protein
MCNCVRGGDGANGGRISGVRQSPNDDKLERPNLEVAHDRPTTGRGPTARPSADGKALLA